MTKGHGRFRTRPARLRLGFLLTLAILLSACSSAPYRYTEFDPRALAAQTQTQQAGGIRVSAAVPGPDQAHALFGFPIYERGIQPVWLEIENETPQRIRYTPTGSDREYFSPLEVAYMHRKGYSNEARAEMEERLYDLGMPRRIRAGETASGFVFTNANPGTKSILVDLFGAGDYDQTFAFFLTVPGFVPDYLEVDFRALYEPEEIQRFDNESFRKMLAAWQCCTDDRQGRAVGLPVSSALIGSGEDVLRALLRAGWLESDRGLERQDFDPDKAHFLFGRLPDTIFQFQRIDGSVRNELSLWLAPWLVDDQPVWMAQVLHFIGQRTRIEQFLFGSRLDPNFDEGLYFLLQNIWYGQGLVQHAWLDYGGAVAVEEERTDYLETEYFTDGIRSVLWVSGHPNSLLEGRRLNWDDPPGLSSQ